MVSAAGTSLLLLILLVTASGCRLSETRESDGPLPDGPLDLGTRPAKTPDLATAMELLEKGRVDAARRLLAALVEDTPDSRLLAKLIRQIDEPVEALLPGPYRRVEVGPGESLSLIAARELGDPLMFFALARLNEIEVPALVPAGFVLRVPETAPTESRREPASPETVETAPEITTAEIESIARELARSGQHHQARALLIDTLAQSGDGAEQSTRDLLARLTLDHAAELREEGALAPAIEVIEQTMATMAGAPQRQELALQRDVMRSAILLDDARGLADRGELADAYRAAQKATDLNSASAEANALVGELRDTLVDDLHNQALLAWRDRNVDFAIRTWESLLEAVPEFEPAQLYLERARRLRDRLD